jgi:hypothetical protein
MRRVEWLASASGDLVGLSSTDDADAIVRAVEDFATRGIGLFSIGETGPDEVAGRLYIAGLPYSVLLRVTIDVVFVEGIVAR